MQAAQAVREGKQNMQDLHREASAAKARRDDAQKKYDTSAAALQALQDEKGGEAAFDAYYRKYDHILIHSKAWTINILYRVMQRCPEQDLNEVIVRMEELEVELNSIVDNKYARYQPYYHSFEFLH